MSEESETEAGATQPEVVIVTGMSGAGRSTAADALEDIGMFVIDNMPPPLIPRVVDLAADRPEHTRIAVGCDVREGRFFSEIDAALHQLAERGVAVRILFLDASDEVLLRRFEESRRPHPLGRGEGVSAGIRREREMLAGLKSRADLILDTSDTNVHEFRAKVKSYFATESGPHALHVTVRSFGFKHGAPRDADMILDVRFIPNPYWVEELRPLSGRDEAVREYLAALPETEEFLEHLFSLVEFLLPHYLAEGKSYLTVAFGCTGGRHRSVYLAEVLADHVDSLGYTVNVAHRDVGS
ncbi:MAG: RNase adapter RapZ [Acidimicrobiia bacterium]|nr:RNase adapter RapZ [Acidimicrobiia bacterium]